jgi:hypothetical protein
MPTCETPRAAAQRLEKTDATTIEGRLRRVKSEKLVGLSGVVGR